MIIFLLIKKHGACVAGEGARCGIRGRARGQSTWGVARKRKLLVVSGLVRQREPWCTASSTFFLPLNMEQL